MEELLRQTKQIDLLVKEMEYQKRLKESLSAGAGDQDYVVTGMIAVFDENARLQRENKALKEELLDLRRQKLFNDEMYFEKLENDILCRKVQLHEIPLWLRRDPVYPALYVRHQPGHRRQACHRVSVPYVRDPRWPLL